MTVVTLPQADVRRSDLSGYRVQFPTLNSITYLNSGSYGLMACSVKAALEQYIADCIARGSDWSDWVGRAERVRGKVAQLLGASLGEIALAGSASDGINAIASALDFGAGRDKIVVSNFEFPTSAQIWHAQTARGARVEHVTELTDNDIPLAHFERAIDETTKLVAITQVCYRNGAKLDIPGIVEIARRKGALVLLDSYQAVGVEPLDVKALDVDFCVGGMVKYLLGGGGLGFLYVKSDLVAQLTPTRSGWFAQADLGAMDIFGNDPAPDARRFQAGTPPVPNLYAAEAGLDLILEVGVEAISHHVRELTGYCMGELCAAGIQLATPTEDHRRGATVAIRAASDHELVQRLIEQGIVTSCRDGNVRAAFHFYNSVADADHLVAALKANRALLRKSGVSS